MSSSEESVEKILQPNPLRFSLFPRQAAYNEIWDLLTALKAQTWKAGEIDTSGDLEHYLTLTPGEQYYLLKNLMFFNSADGIVMENISSNFAREVQVPEIRHFYSYVQYNESEHSESYSLMLDAILPNQQEKLQAFRAMVDDPSVRELTQWALRWLDAERYPFRVRLVAFIIYEGLVFSSKFVAIFWFKQKNLLPGISQGNVLIARDESGHETGGILIHNQLTQRCERELAEQMIREAVAIDGRFTQEALSRQVLGLTAVQVQQYIHCVADRILTRLGYVPIYNENMGSNIVWTMMESLALDLKINFFERRSTTYVEAFTVSKPPSFQNLRGDF